jgi:hypothetical protein
VKKRRILFRETKKRLSNYYCRKRFIKEKNHAPINFLIKQPKQEDEKEKKDIMYFFSLVV